ncbi:ATP-binding protein [Sulfolobales archaeon HS-7]|nr:ATP-binding protein [Sulfolobales archaeon HS-7]
MKRLCALASGGKDSNYAIHWAMTKGFDVILLITFIPARGDSWMFQKVGTELVSVQAEALGISIRFFHSSGKKENEYNELVNAFNYCKKIGGEGVLTGALRSDYQRINIALAAYEVGLRTFNPLWRKDEFSYVKELVAFGFKFVVISYSALGFPSSLLGKEVDKEEILELLSAAKKYNFSPAFEGGEAETFVTSAPFYSFSISITGKPYIIDEFSGIYLIDQVKKIPKRVQ